MFESLQAIRHRGPDDLGWLSWDDSGFQRGRENKPLNGRLLMGHVRLSILDLSEAGWQPMSSVDGLHHIVFNGEIYNYKELKKELELLGYAFHTHSDTEVLLYALKEWGERALGKLRGMFAFCYFNATNRECLIARDFFGIKPLYFCETNAGFAFASEQGALLSLPGVGREIHPQSLYEYLIAGITDHNADTVLADVKRLPAGHYLRISIDVVALPAPQRYWGIDLARRINPTFEQATARVRELFLESVALHLRSDVPIGTALSGGVDSSAIVCAVRYLNPKQEIHTFSFIADEERINEEKWIDLVNAHVHAIPHKVHATHDDLLADLNDLIQGQGEPFGSTSIYAQYRVFKEAAANQIKVMLDGQGADEMLAGYISYQGTRLASLLKKGHLLMALDFLRASSSWPGRNKKTLLLFASSELLPDWARRLGRKLISKGVPPDWLSHEWLKGVRNLRPDSARHIECSDVMRGRLLDTLQRSSIPFLLRYEDRNSMRFSIESRVPFLYTDLVEYIYSLPEEYIIAPDGTSKYVFREAMRGIVPDAILDRKDKIGFATPERAWLSKMDDWVEHCLGRAELLGCFDEEKLRAEWGRALRGEVPFEFRCWRWLNAIEWYASVVQNKLADAEK